MKLACIAGHCWAIAGGTNIQVPKLQGRDSGLQTAVSLGSFQFHDAAVAVLNLLQSVSRQNKNSLGAEIIIGARGIMP